MALNESALMEQFKATVALKDSEISKIHAENEKLSTELKKIKNRYKGMRTILDEAELKEKVAILLEVEQLRKVSKIILITVHEYYISYYSKRIQMKKLIALVSIGPRRDV